MYRQINPARRLTEDLKLPLISKDEIKELLFDNLGCQDREWSKKLGGMAFEILYWSMEKVLAAGLSLIVDVDFSNPAAASERLAILGTKCPFRLLRITLVTNGTVLFERFQHRSTSGERHPGHVDHTNFEEFKPMLLKGRREVADIGGENLEIDTTDFQNLPYRRVLSSIREKMPNGLN